MYVLLNILVLYIANKLLFIYIHITIYNYLYQDFSLLNYYILIYEEIEAMNTT